MKAKSIEKILVTGGAGFIGSHTVDLLIKHGYEAIIIDNLEPQVHGKTKPDYINKDATFIRHDIKDQNFLSKIVSDARAQGGGEEKMKLGKDSKVFLSVSKLHRRKRIDKALKIYEERSKNLEKSMFIIVGEGPEEHNLRRLVKIMNLKNVEFVGRIPDEELPLYYSAADYFIFTAKDEPFGIAPLEAR